MCSHLSDLVCAHLSDVVLESHARPDHEWEEGPALARDQAAKQVSWHEGAQQDVMTSTSHLSRLLSRLCVTSLPSR